MRNMVYIHNHMLIVSMLLGMTISVKYSMPVFSTVNIYILVLAHISLVSALWKCNKLYYLFLLQYNWQIPRCVSGVRVCCGVIPTVSSITVHHLTALQQLFLVARAFTIYSLNSCPITIQCYGLQSSCCTWPPRTHSPCNCKFVPFNHHLTPPPPASGDPTAVLCC